MLLIYRFAKHFMIFIEKNIIVLHTYTYTEVENIEKH